MLQAVGVARPPDKRVATDQHNELAHAISAHTAVVGVVGQGYVGFALAQRAAEVGFPTFGVDINPLVVARALEESAVPSYRATTDASVLAGCDVILIAVPTPTLDTDSGRHGDLSLVAAAAEGIAQQIARDPRPRLLLSESTYAPGTTRNVVMPIIEPTRGGARVFYGYSPERIDPGNEIFGIAAIPKIVSGADSPAADLTKLFYEQIVDDVIPASSMEAAEATKLLENTFRFVNIAFAQEFDEYCHTIDLNSHEVTRLASTKPFGFLPFFAGTGVGGHCIAEDPYYLYDSMSGIGANTSILSTAMGNQDARASVVVHRIREQLGERGLRGARILVMGVTYKPNVADTRRSPAVPVMRLLEQSGAIVDYHDPYVPTFEGKTSVDVSAGTATNYDLVAFLVEHKAFDSAAMEEAGCNTFRVSITRRPTRTEAA